MKTKLAKKKKKKKKERKERREELYQQIHLIGFYLSTYVTTQKAFLLLFALLQ
jgi:hypothetical protein